MAARTAPGRIAPKRHGRWADASPAGRALVTAWGLCILSLVVAFGTVGFFKLFTDAGGCLARVGCFGVSMPWGFWEPFAAGTLFAVLGLALLPVWLMDRLRRRERR